MAVGAERVVGGAEVGDVVAGEDGFQRCNEIALYQAGRQLGRGLEYIAVEMARLRADDGLRGVLVEWNVFGLDLDVFLRTVELRDHGGPCLAAVTFFHPP